MTEQKRGSLSATLLGVTGPLVHLGILLVGVVVLLAVEDAKEFFVVGGWAMWALIPVTLFGLLLELVVAVRVTRHQDSWAWPLVLAPLFTGAVGLAGFWGAMHMTLSAVAGEPPAGQFGLWKAGFAESLSNITLAAILCAVLFSTASSVMGARALSRVEQKRLVGSGVHALWLSIVLLVGLAIATILWEPLQWAQPYPWLPAISGCLAMVLSGIALSGSRANQTGHGHAMADCLSAVLFAVSGVGMAAVAAWSLSLARRFAAFNAVQFDKLYAESYWALLTPLVLLIPVGVAALSVITPRAVVLGRGVARGLGALFATVLVAGLLIGGIFVSIDYHRGTAPSTQLLPPN